MKNLKTLYVSLSTGVLLLLTACVHQAGSNWDDQKVSQIKKGETTEAELLQWFGTPIHRNRTSEGITTLSWSHAEIRQGLSLNYFNPAPIRGQSNKTLTVMLGPDGKVTSFSTGGSAYGK